MQTGVFGCRYATGDTSRHRSSGSSGGGSSRGVSGAKSGVIPPGGQLPTGPPFTRPRRLHRPADYDSGGSFHMYIFPCSPIDRWLPLLLPFSAPL